MRINKNNLDVSFNNYLSTINTLFKKHAPIKYLNRRT